ncbi:MAG: ABC transporter substrate-binding protein [Desulfobacterales bacterium]|nr:MAG: ABC transporter substrate-binding protein [Desulfobacterales bacterium]
MMSKIRMTDDRMDRRTFLKVTGAAGLGVTVSAWGVPKLLRAEPAPIKIGSVQPATGPLAVIGQGQRRGNQMAVDYINSRGGIQSLGGAKLELLLGDSESKAEVGRSEADRLIQEGAVMLIGAFQSGVSMAIATLAEQRQVPFVMDVAALDDITQKGYQHVFRLFPTVSVFGETGVAYVKQIITEKKVEPQRAVVTNTGDPFGKSQGENFIKWFEKSGLPIEIVDHITYPLGIHDLSAEVAKIKAAKPDLLFPVCRPGDSIILTRELHKQRVPLMGIISPGSPGWYEPKVIQDLDKLVYYVMDNVPWVYPASPVYQEANKLFQEKYGTYLDTNSGYAYAGILVSADALNRAASTKTAALLQALRETDFKDHPMVGKAVQFKENGDNINAATAMVQVLPDPDPNRRVKVVLPKEFAEADYVFPAKQLWERE